MVLVWVTSLVIASMVALLGLLFLVGRRLHRAGLLFPPTLTHSTTADSINGRVSATTLLVLRALYLLLSVGVVVFVLVNNQYRPWGFFTVWNYLLQTVYFGLVVGRSLVPDPKPSAAAAVVVGGGEDGAAEAQRALHWADKLAFVLNGVNLTFVVMVAVVLWTILLPHALSEGEGRTVLNFASYMMHAANVPAVFGEFFLNRHFVAPPHFVFCLTWLAVYGVFTAVWQWLGGFPPYFFSDASKPLTPALMVGVLVGCVLFFGVALALNALKRRVYASAVQSDALLGSV